MWSVEDRERIEGDKKEKKRVRCPTRVSSDLCCVCQIESVVTHARAERDAAPAII